MIYLSKYQNNTSPEPVDTMESTSRGFKRSCGRIEEVYEKTITQTLFNPLTLLSAKHKPMRKFLLPAKAMGFVMILLFSVSLVKAQTITTTGSGNWNSTTADAPWPGGTVPLSTDLVIIANTHTVTVTAAATIAGVTINNGGTLTWSAAVSLNLNGPFVNNGTFTKGSGTVTFGGTSAAINAGTGTPDFNIITFPLTVTTLTINTPATATTLTFPASNADVQVIIAGTNSLAVSGALTITRPDDNTITSTLSVGAGTLSAGSISLGGTGAGTRITEVTISTGTVTVSGNITSAGNLSRLTFTGAGTLNAGGTFMSGKLGTFTASTGKINYTGASANLGSFAYTYYDLQFSGTGTSTASATVAVQHDLTNTGGGTLGFGSQAVTLSGTNTQSIAGFTTTGLISVTKTAGTASFQGVVNGGALTISSSGGTLNLGTGLTHTISGTPGTLTLGVYGQPSGSWGGTGSAATYINTTYFAAATGILNVATSSCTWIGVISTNWNDASNWGDATVPIASTNVVIPSGGNQPVIGAAAVCNNITVNSGATLIISGSNTLTVSGNWTNSGTFTAPSSTVIFNGADQTVGIGPFNNLTLSTSGTKTLAVATTINGNLTINTGVTLAMSTFLLTLNGDLINNGGTTSGSDGVTITGTATQNIGAFTTTGTVSMTKTEGTATFTGNVNGDALTINGSGGTLNLGTGLTHTFTGAVTLTAGTLDSGSSTLNENKTGASAWNGTGSLFTAGISTVNFGAAGNQTLSATTTTFYNLTLSNSGTKTLGAATIINGDLTITGVTLAMSTFLLTLNGNLINTGGTTSGSGGVTITGTATQSIGAFTTTGTVTMTKTGGTATFTGNVNGAGLTINGTGGTLNLGAGTHTFTGAVALTNGTLNGGSSTLNENMVSLTAWDGTGTNFTAGTSTVNFGAAGAQTLSATATTFNNLTLSASGTKTFAAATTINGALSISGTATANLGTYTSSTNTLTLEGNGQPSGSWGGTTSGTTHINSAYFATATGILNVAVSGCSAGTWIGTTSTDWHTASNWCDGAVPTASTDVVIPSGGNQPSIGVAGGLSRNITVNSGATLTITGSNTLTVSGNWTNSGTFTAGTSTVIFNGAGDQTGAAVTYNNLTLSGSGEKTFATTPTVNGILSMEETATVVVSGTGVVTYGTNATLQYNTATARTVTSEEWINTFAATGGVIIDNTGTIALNANKEFSASVPLTINSGATLSTSENTYNVTFGGDFHNNGGTFTTGNSQILIAGTAVTQSIDGFTTTGNVSMTKTAGTATFQENVNGDKLTINGTGGTLNLGTGLTHTFTGVVTLTAGTLDGGSSTLNENKTGATAWNGTGSLFTAGTSTVNFGAAGNQTIATATTFNNLTLSNSGTKTLEAATIINGDLTITGVTLAMSTFLLTLNGDLINNGGTTSGSGGVTITGTATQSIGAFTTTGTVTMTKTERTATFTGNVNGAGLTINGTGGTLNLGAGTHTFTGAVALTNGTLNGGSSTLNENMVSLTAWDGTGTNFTAGTSTVNFGAAGDQTLSATATTFNNLILSDSGTKTFATATTINGDLSISGTAAANLGTYTSSSNTLTLGGTGQPSGSWGGTGSGATYINTTYFAAATGILNVATSGCTAGTWIGGISTDWNTASNWCDAAVPTASTNVVIPSGGNQPVIGAAAVCNDISVNSGATLTITGSNTLTVSGNWTNSGTFTANSSTVIFNGAAQTVGTGPYNNLTLAGSGIKTTTGVAVNGILSMEGTATVSVVPTYGASATLQYNTVTSRTTGAEWLTPFAATGGIIIANTGAITLSAAKVFNVSVPLTINNGATLYTSENTYNLTFGGDFHNNGGTFITGDSPIVITNTAVTQSIDGFTTTGTVSMTKTAGTATFQGNVSGNGLTIKGTGGTLNLGVGLTHTFTGAVALNNGTLNGGSSTLNENKTGATAWNGTGSLFTAGTGTVNFGAAGNQTLSATITTFNNLTLSASGTKTLEAATTINGNLLITGTAIANLGIFTSSSQTLSLGGLGVVSGSWGGTTSAATNINTTYFETATGILNVTLSSYADGSWIGETSTDWNTASNWFGGVLPTSLTNVVINSGGNQPIINAASVCNNLDILSSSATLTISGSNTLTVSGNWTNNGTFTANSSTVIYNAAGAQTCAVVMYNNLTLSGSGIKTFATTPTVNGILSMEEIATVTVSTGVVTYGTNATLQYNTATARTVTSEEWITPFEAAGGVIIDNTGTITLNAAKVFNASVQLTINSGATLNTSASTFRLTFGGDFHNNGGTFITGDSPIVITNTAVTQSIDGFTTTGTVSMTKTAGTATFQGNVSGAGLTINGLGGTLNLGAGLTHEFSGTWIRDDGTLYGGSSTLKIAGSVNGSIGTFTAGTGTVEWNGAEQTLAGVTYNNLTLSGSGIKTLSAGTIINGALTLTNGTLTIGPDTLTIAGSSPTLTSGVMDASDSTATLTFTNTSPIVLPASFFTGNVNNLTLNGIGGVTLGNNTTVIGTLNLTSGNLTVTDPYILTMGGSATTIGAGDVTGIVKRSTLVANTTYAFGNQYTTINFQNIGTLPSEVSMKITIGSAPSWKTDAVQRTYDIIQTGGNGSFATLNLHYLDTELNGNTENKLVKWACDAPFTPGTVVENGRSNYDETNNWVGTSSFDVSLWPTSFDTRIRAIGNSALSNATWNGSISTVWTNPGNWTPNGIPSDLSDIVIPDASTTLNDPTLGLSLSVGRMTINSGGILNSAANYTVTISGGSGAWSNNGGTFNPSIGTVIFTDSLATISGATDFYNVTINSGVALTLGSGGTMRISGTMTNNGTWRAAQLANNTVEYNGGSQTVLNPNGLTSGYDNLILSGSEIKTMPGNALAIAGNFSMSGSAMATPSAMLTVSGTTTLSGTSILTIGANDILSNTGAVTLNGGTFKTGATTGFSETVGTFELSDNSTIVFGTDTHSLNFAASDGVSWISGKILTVTGWTGGYDGTSGTAGKIYMGSNASGLTAGQLAQIQFYDGSTYFPAILRSDGEVVPTGDYITTGTINGSPFCAGASGLNVPFTYALSSKFSLATFTAQLSDASGSFTSPVTLQSVPSDVSGSQSISVTIPSGTTTGTGYRIRVVSNAPAVTGSDGTNLTVNALPTVDAGPDATIPNGTSTTLNATVTGTYPFSYSWTPSSQLVNALIEDPITINLASTTIFTLTATSITGCSNTDAVTITISGGVLTSTPTATPATVCAGENVQLNAMVNGGSGSYTCTWTSSPAGFTSSVINPIANPTVNTTYNVVVFDGFNSVNSQVAVTVNPLPTISMAYVIPTSVCVSGQVVFSATTSTGTIKWYTALTGGTEVTVLNPTINATTTYYAEVTSPAECISAARTAVTATVNTTPGAPTGTATQSFCSGALPTVANLAATGTSIQWYAASTGGSALETSAALVNGTYYYASQTVSGCESSARFDVTATVNTTPGAPTVGTITQPTCAVTTGSVVLNGLPATGTWTLTRTPGGTTATGTGISSTISGLEAGIYTYIVSNSAGCTSAASANVVIEVAKIGVVPKIKVKFGDLLICYNLGDSIKSYQWYKGVDPISNATTQYYQTKGQSGTYKVETIDKNWCVNFSNEISTSGTKSLSVYPNPTSVSFALKLNDESGGRAIVSIINSAGIKVMEFQVENINDELLKEIPVNNLDEGIYFVQVLLDNKDLYYTKIVVIK